MASFAEASSVVCVKRFVDEIDDGCVGIDGRRLDFLSVKEATLLGQLFHSWESVRRRTPHDNANLLLTNSRVSDDHVSAARRCDGCDREVLNPSGSRTFLFGLPDEAVFLKHPKC